MIERIQLVYYWLMKQRFTFKHMAGVKGEVVGDPEFNAAVKLIKRYKWGNSTGSRY